MGDNGEAWMEIVRQELRAILRRGNRITERDLLRLSARTGLDYATVLRIQRELT